MSLSSVGSDSIGCDFDDSLVIFLFHYILKPPFHIVLSCVFRTALHYAPLNPRTAAQYLTFLSEVARGRYGCVQKALFRTREVAVKTFYTNEEESWRNEKDIYETRMLNHENILRKLFLRSNICVILEGLQNL